MPGDRTYTTGISDDGGVRIANAAVVPVAVDGVASQDAGEDQCREGTGLSFPGVNADNGFERIDGSQDTDRNSIDFTGPKASDPQNSSADPAGDAAPRVASSDPGELDLGADPDGSIAVTFSEPVTTGADPFSLACADGSTFGRDGDDRRPEDLHARPGREPAARRELHADRARRRHPRRRRERSARHDGGQQDRQVLGRGGRRLADPRHPGRGASLAPRGQDRRSRPGRRHGRAQQRLLDAGRRRRTPTRATSEGIFVFTGSAPTVAAGAAVTVSGLVAEFRPGGATTDNLTTTELERVTVTPAGAGAAIAPTVVGAGGRVPPAQVIEDDASGSVETSGIFDSSDDGIDFYESLEGMKLQVNDAVVVGPTNARGELFVVADGGASAGVRTSRGGIVISPDDFNPERIQLDDVLADTPDVHVGDRLPGATVGVLSYDFGNFELLPADGARADSGPDRARDDRRRRAAASSPSRRSTSRTSTRPTRRRSRGSPSSSSTTCRRPT